jgi:hypothetical protein
MTAARPALAGMRLGLVAAAGLAVSVTAAAQTYDWTNDVPPTLKGVWVIQDQRCDDPNSQAVIFSDGGYRWRKSRTDWGFARGKYSYTTPTSALVYFRLQRFIPREAPDFQINVSGTSLRKYSFGSGVQVKYDKCLNGLRTE